MRNEQIQLAILFKVGVLRDVRMPLFLSTISHDEPADSVWYTKKWAMGPEGIFFAILIEFRGPEQLGSAPPPLTELNQPELDN